MYWLTLISSIVGIISFVFSFFEYFKEWRKYLIHITFFTIGLTSGLLLSMSEKTIQQFTQAQLIYLVAFVSIIALLIIFVYRFLTVGKEPLFVVMIVLGVLGYFSVRLLNSVEKSQSFLKPTDYLIISNHYNETKEYSKSAEYLRKYRELETINLSEPMLKKIDDRIDSLNTKQIENFK